MSSDPQLHQTAEEAMTAKYGKASLFGKNNQYGLHLENGKRAVVKTGSKGQVMQRTHGDEIDARFSGVADADLVVIAVRNSAEGPIAVYEVPADVYRDRMTSAYKELLQSNQLRPSDLRVLRFDEKGYAQQRVADEWSKYRLPTNTAATKNTSPQNQDESTTDAMRIFDEAKEMVARAFGIPKGNVSISISM
jgi:hypothetical protein